MVTIQGRFSAYPAYLLVGVIGYGAPYILLAYVAPKIPAGIVAMTLSLNPIIVYGLALLIRMEGFRGLRFSVSLWGLPA